MDGIDAALVEFQSRNCTLKATLSSAYPEELRGRLFAAVIAPHECDVDAIGELDHWVGVCFRDAVIELLTNNGFRPDEVRAIGSHGQTLRHRPKASRPFTTQLGDPNIIAAGTGITTIADFRRGDMAVGGEGAPLTPAFHQWRFASDKVDRIVLNIGGIANITVLPADGSAPSGFDTGPGNTLMDAWIQQHRNAGYDDNGAWASSGQVSSDLLLNLLQDSYFSQPPPKSTGREYFNLDWMSGKLASFGELPAQDIQATLSALTARSIAAAISSNAPSTGQVLVCGGGVHNTHLMDQLATQLAEADITSTEPFGLHPDWVEATAFAWLAHRTLAGKPGNLPSVTGAQRAAVLGGIYLSGS